MTASFFLVIIGLWVLYAGWRFYKQVNWEEAPVPTPDRSQLKKREAELLHIQEVLEDSHAQGKLSAQLLNEYKQFCEKELAELHAVAQPKR